MDINNVNNQPNDRKIVDRDRPDARRPANTDGKAADRPARDGDRVELSAEASGLKKLETEIKSADAVNRERVAAIKERIASGEYHIDAARLADKIIQLEDQL